eukprot:CAMPEP_0203764050 /NCGR_PEP_ID=MMETSP0098-20131031/17351_1 /ASSEMBLY_ACC=CAM_ASM_000208 /TAXON_ID=96639 /ORGANISM=" , Strain NY0313808BC1" /LENGTH=332 /DNA_ID=CAMNT_0050659669 /DNA_START=105 /DNA_END=1100 /DNA_ORIENTATION=+
MESQRSGAHIVPKGDIEKALSVNDDAEACVNSVLESIGIGRFHATIFVPAILACGADFSEASGAGFILPILKDVFTLTKVDMSTYTMVSSVGLATGSVFFGVVGDRFGRKPVIVVTCAGTFVFGALSALSSSFKMLLALRFVTSFFVSGGVPTVLPLACEWVSHRHNKHAIILTLGGGGLILFLFVSLVGRFLLVGSNPQWRLFLLIEAIPCFIATLSCITLSESPRLLYRTGKLVECVSVLEKAARINKVEIPSQLLVKLKNSQQQEHDYAQVERKRCDNWFSSCLLLVRGERWKVFTLLVVLFSALYTVATMFQGTKTLMLVAKFHSTVW